MDEANLLLPDRLEVIGFSLIWALASLWIAKRAGFFLLPHKPTSERVSFEGWVVIVAFLIFLSVQVLGAFTGEIFRISLTNEEQGFSKPPKMYMLWYGMIGTFLAGGCLFLFTRSRPPKTQALIWGYTEKGFMREMRTGVATWFLAYPIVIIIAQLTAITVRFVDSGPFLDQVAVRQIKEAIEHPVLFTTMLITVTIVVPVIEELLFRGYLQSWLKIRINWQAGIAITSLIFAAFHLSGSQGINNIEIFIALFFFSLFLGYVYEWSGSLWAPIGLHIAFNTISTAMILWKDIFITLEVV